MKGDDRATPKRPPDGDSCNRATEQKAHYRGKLDTPSQNIGCWHTHKHNNLVHDPSLQHNICYGIDAHLCPNSHHPALHRNNQ